MCLTRALELVEPAANSVPTIDIAKVSSVAGSSFARNALSVAGSFGLLLALPAARTWPGDKARWRGASRLLLNLGRLFAEAIENAPEGPAFALRVRGVGEGRIFLHASLPQIHSQLLSYTLYRSGEQHSCRCRSGCVGAGGLGQMLAFHLGLFQMAETRSILAAMLVLLVDAASYAARRLMSR